MKNHARSLARWLLLPPALFALACALFAPAEAGRAPARRASQEQRRKSELPSSSAVRGRVVYDDTSRPVRRARVMLAGEGGVRSEYGALTDARGEFRIEGVRAGSYFAFVDLPGALSPVAFVSMEELRDGSMPDLGEGRAFFDLVEVDGKQDVTVTVHARRGASIAGRVTYADDDPAVNVMVNLLRRGADGRLQRSITGANIVSAYGLRTDDRGMYRLTGLPPGEYVIGVSEAADHTPDGKRRRSDDIPGALEAMMGQQLLMTFHPSATSPKEAAVVKVAAGDERTDVDVRIPERELRTVAGVVRARRDKRPLARARVSIERRDDPLGASLMTAFFDGGEARTNSTTTDEEGRWEFREIPDGPYTIVVKPAEEYEPGAAAAVMMNANVSVTSVTPSAENRNGIDYRPPRRKRGYAPARREVDVSGDVSDVAVELGDSARISGTVAVAGGGESQNLYVLLVRVPEDGARPDGDDAYNTEVSSGRFSFEELPPGKYFLQPNGSYPGEEKLYLKSVTWNGKDLTREPLELAEGVSAEGVEVVFARKPATVRLAVVRAGGKPAAYATLFLIPVDAADWSPYSTRRLSCATNSESSCVVVAPPGEYYVVALSPNVPQGAAEAEVRRRAPLSPRVTLRAGETKEFEVTVPDK